MKLMPPSDIVIDGRRLPYSWRASSLSLVLIGVGAKCNGMTPPTANIRTHVHNANLAAFSFLTFIVMFILLYAGGFTTTIGAGMVFPDWPLSNGSLNPPGWTTDQAMLAEHSHRLLGMLVGFLTVVLAIWIHYRERRAWVRRLVWLALALVIVQGLLGGLRVRLDSLDTAMVHGIFGQVVFCTMMAVVVGLSRWWRELPQELDAPAARSWRRMRLWGLVLCGGIFVQLVVGAMMRHRGAGLAIPYFPHAQSNGSWLPTSWNWATQIHFAHRILAVLVCLMLLAWVVSVFRASGATTAIRKLALAAFVLVFVQISLGASVIWSTRAPFQTTLHMLNGAVFFAVAWAGTFASFRPLLEPAEGADQALGQVRPGKTSGERGSGTSGDLSSAPST